MSWRFREVDVREGRLVARVGPDPEVTGSPVATDGPDGGSLLFDGKDDRAVVAEDLHQLEGLLPRKEFTISAWFSVNTRRAYGGVFSVVRDNGGLEKGWVLGYRDANFYLALASEGANDGDGVMTYLHGRSSYELGRMYHVVGTYNGKEMRLYVNGKLDGTSDVQSGDILYPAATPVVLAGYRDDNEDFLHHGRIREITIYHQAVSRRWITNNFRKNAPLAKADPLIFPDPVPEVMVDPAHVAGQDWGPWYVIGPFKHDVGPSNMSPATAVEKYLHNMDAGEPAVSLDKDHLGRWGRVEWEQLGGLSNPRAVDVGVIDFNAVLKPEEPKPAWNARCSAYLYRVLETEEAGTVELQMGSDDGLRLWLNGQLIVESTASRGLNATDHTITLNLSQGTNHILAKIVNDDGGWSYQMRSWDGVPYRAVNEAIDRGVKFLLSRQLVDGSWASHPEYGAGYTAYATYTLLKCGLSPKHPAIRRAMTFVRTRPADHTYSLSCRILALATLNDEQDRELLQGDLERLLDFQEGTGLYAYPVHPNGSVLPNDLSCTLFATLALRAADHRGVEVPDRTWRRLIQGTLQCQGPEEMWKHPRKGRMVTSPFGYRPNEGYRGSMTSAGASILHIAIEELGDHLESGLKRKAERGIEGGLAWIEKNMTWQMNPGGGHHYFHIYGMERLGSLLNKRMLGGVEWYATGADYLLRNQKPDGCWVDSLVDTALALLFLERATAPSTGATRDPDERLHISEPMETGVAFRVLAKTPIVVWITGFGPATLAELEWTHDRGRGPRVRYAEFLVKEPGEAEARMVQRVDVDPTVPLGAQRLSVQLDLPITGTHEFQVRVCALLEPLEEGLEDLIFVESAILGVPLEGGFPPETFEYCLDRDLNLLPKTQPTAEASSQFGSGYDPSQVLDGRHDTRWECAADDANPTLKIHLRRSVRAERLLFSHAWARLKEKTLARVERFEVILNERFAHTLEMDPHPLRKTELRLKKSTKIRDIEIRILKVRDGTLGQNKVGFSEVQLLK